MSKILIECRGGLVQDVYGAGEAPEFHILDWDEFGEGVDPEPLDAATRALEMLDYIRVHGIDVPHQVIQDLKEVIERVTNGL